MSGCASFLICAYTKQSESPLEKKNEIQRGNSQRLVPFTRNIYSLSVKKFVVSFICIN